MCHCSRDENANIWGSQPCLHLWRQSRHSTPRQRCCPMNSVYHSVSQHLPNMWGDFFFSVTILWFEDPVEDWKGKYQFFKYRNCNIRLLVESTLSKDHGDASNLEDSREGTTNFNTQSTHNSSLLIEKQGSLLYQASECRALKLQWLSSLYDVNLRSLRLLATESLEKLLRAYTWVFLVNAMVYAH